MRGGASWIGPLAMLALGVAPAWALDVEARLDRRQVLAGETTTLRVVVRGASGARSPEFDLPAGLVQLGSGRQQSFSWVNGRATVETEFRFEILAENTGRYAIGPIRVNVGGSDFRSGELQLQVLAQPPVSGGRTVGAPATLRVEVEPAEPYIGQEVVMRVRLLQRTSFTEDPQYVPPTTTGFWTDRPSAPESYYDDVRGERLLVTETRTRLYPLAVGEATIGEATASVVPEGASGDPFSLGGLDRRQVVLRSQPVPVRVRPLPGDPPAGFGGAVGTFEAAWSSDRARTTRDVPVTLRLDVRGRGNLPLVRPPAFGASEFEVFASTSDDSLGTAAAAGQGRKRFQWTLLPKREGRIAIASPGFSWFDPADGRYHQARMTPAVVDVGPALFAGGAEDAGFARVLVEHPADPGATPAVPWAFALAGASLGGAWTTWRRRGPRKGASGVETSSAWLERLQGVHGDEFWRLAEEAGRWLESRGQVKDVGAWRAIRAQVSAARYGGNGGDEAELRRAYVRELAAPMTRSSGRIPARAAAVALALIALGACVTFAPHRGDQRMARGAAAADQVARRGEPERARRAWAELWDRAGHDPRLAARIAWFDLQAGDVGHAALWVSRGELAAPRDAAVSWVDRRVRDAGGLVGASPAHWPITSLEWSIAAFLLALATIAVFPRRLAVALGVLAAACALIDPAQDWWAERSGRAIIVQRVTLEGTDVELDRGQMVRLRERRAGRSHVEAGRVVEGWVPSSAVVSVVERGSDRD